METYHSHIMKLPNLPILGILKESFKIPIQNPKFLVLSVLVSLPLFFATLLHELSLHQTLIQISKSLIPPPPICFDSICTYTVPGPIYYINIAFRQASQIYLPHGLAYLGLILVLDLLAAVGIINWSSAIYIGDKTHDGTGLKLKGPMVTSAYVLLLASITQIGLVWLTGWCVYLAQPGPYSTGFESIARIGLVLVFGGMLVGLFGKYEEWSGVWAMSVVMSVVEGEEKQGIVAIGVSGYLTRRCRVRGMGLAFGFWLWRMGLRTLGFYMVWGAQGNDGAVAVNGVLLGLGCVGNVMKWVVFVVYFFDCKKKFLEKKVTQRTEEAYLHPRLSESNHPIPIYKFLTFNLSQHVMSSLYVIMYPTVTFLSVILYITNTNKDGYNLLGVITDHCPVNDTIISLLP